MLAYPFNCMKPFCTSEATSQPIYARAVVKPFCTSVAASQPIYARVMQRYCLTSLSVAYQEVNSACILLSMEAAKFGSTGVLHCLQSSVYEHDSITTALVAEGQA